MEIALARRITERYSKDQVLEFYLNRVYFGSGFYGIRAASLGYFGKEPADLTTREAASIAALIKNPNGLSPLNNPESNLKWRNHVLNRMAREKYITPDEAERLSAMDLGLNPRPLKRGVSHIYDRISAEITAYLGEDRVNAAGLKIYTTLDRKLQEATGKSLEQALENIEKRPGLPPPEGRGLPRSLRGQAALPGRSPAGGGQPVRRRSGLPRRQGLHQAPV